MNGWNETPSGVIREWQIPAPVRTSPRHRDAWIVIATSALLAFVGPQILVAWPLDEWRFRGGVTPLGLCFLPFLGIGIVMLSHAKRMAATARILRIHGETATLLEDRRGKVKESRLPLDEIRTVRQKRFRGSYCWGVEIIGRGRSFRIETPWPQDQVGELVGEIKSSLWTPGDPCATRA